MKLDEKCSFRSGNLTKPKEINSNGNVKKLYQYIERYYKRDKELVLQAISALADIYYHWNQFYTDVYLEDLLTSLTAEIMSNKTKEIKAQDHTILFYDAFGSDTRGLALIYLKALKSLGYKIIYVSVEEYKDKQPAIRKVLQGSDTQYRYIKKYEKLTKRIDDLYKIFVEVRPQYAFLYTLPNDVAGIMVFRHFEKTLKRFQINLTDHAFWLGKNAFDVCLEFRPYGVAVSQHYRNIPIEKTVCLPYYPAIHREEAFQGFPFEVGERTKVLFSGGYLYKTIDVHNTYYHMVEAILRENEDVIFLYAGQGDCTRLLELQKKFPDRVYYIPERRDLYQVLKHSYLYLNTYPMCGGLMMQYAVAAEKIPLTLKHEKDMDGILLEQECRKIEYTDEQELIADAHRLFEDEEYLKSRTALLCDSIPTEETFTERLGQIIDGKVMGERVEKIDTDSFRRDYYDRFDDEIIRRAVIKKYHKKLWCRFPKLFIRGVMSELFQKRKHNTIT